MTQARTSVGVAILAATLVAPALLFGQSAPIPIAQNPLFVRAKEPPLNMLVVARDHNLFYEAYNDASDLNGDGQLDIGYNPDPNFTYFGYFDSAKCYNYVSGVFRPVGPANNKRCSGQWSGDWLNYVTMSRMDAMRKVLYGGTRFVDTASETILERAFITQDGHSWAKEYQSIARDGYDISQYTPLPLPPFGYRHLFGNVTRLNDANQLPLLRVLPNSRFRLWEWASIERPVLEDECAQTGGNVRVPCQTVGGTSWSVVPAEVFSNVVARYYNTTGIVNPPTGTPPGLGQPHPYNQADFNNWRTWVVGNPSRLIGTRTLMQINCTANCNLASGQQDDYMTIITGQLNLPPGIYRFIADGDDAVQFSINGVRVAGWYGGHGTCNPNSTIGCGAGAGANVNPGTFVVTGTEPALNFEFLQQERAGGDAYRLWWEQVVPASQRTDYVVRVEVCNVSVGLEPNCRAYPRNTTNPTSFKPGGLLHDYGEDNRMMFGMVTGSYSNNLEGGVLRKAVSSFQNELDLNTGVFSTSTSGIVRTLDRLRVIGFGGTFEHSSGGCPGLSRPINSGECRSWGNPVAEMMLESLRYFAGANGPLPAFAYLGGTPPDNTLGLPLATWNSSTNPYGPGNFQWCSRPFQTVIADVNPNYDTNLLPSITTVGPSAPPLNVVALGQTIWNAEYGGTRRVFIGRSGAINDAAPTPKDVNSFGNIAGISPEEPTKGGGYFSASLAYYGHTNDINAATGRQSPQTFSVALTSRVPRITFPVTVNGNASTVTLVLFGKTVSGTFGGDPVFKPTNTIVDFYVERLVNLPGTPTIPAINGGRPYARFRVNYEDVEQGNDHDMDAIVLYDISVNASNQLVVTLTSEYAAGSANQNMGYVISGTTQDGIYLEVADVDTSDNGGYILNTPPGVNANGCNGAVGVRPAVCEVRLPFSTTRVFTPGTTQGAMYLKDPLWYAAKYGGFTEDATTANGLPDQQREWDAEPRRTDGTFGDGVPDNYFPVTNANRLREQLAQAFDEILRRANPAGQVATNSTRIDTNTLAYQAIYEVQGNDWTGDVRAFRLNSDGTRGPRVWVASERLPAWEDRNLATWDGSAGVNFTFATLPAPLRNEIETNPTRSERIVNYIRGDRSFEVQVGLDPAVNAQRFRQRSKLIGDILNSNPAISARQDFGYCALPVPAGGSCDPAVATSYGRYLETVKTTRAPLLFVGANAGVFHVFDGSGPCPPGDSNCVDSGNGGRELFGFIPRNVLGNLRLLTDRAYEHRYFVDGSPTVGDAFIGGSWRTVVVSATGAGGRSVFAIDATSTSFGPGSVMWEFTDPDLGVAIGQPKIARLNDGTWAAIFGNGYNSANNRAMLFIVNLANGSLIRKIDTGVGTSAATNGLASPTVIDANDIRRYAGLSVDRTTLRPDFIADVVYAGDLRGNMWKFDLSATTASAWSVANAGSPVFVATSPGSGGARQAITAAPQAVRHPLGGVMLLFGTGRFFAVGDNLVAATGEQVHSFYGVRDLGTASYTRANLAVQTISEVFTSGSQTIRRISDNTIDWNNQAGFVLDLPSPPAIAGERVITQPQVRFGVAFFSTFAPSGGTCDARGNAFLMALDPFSGTGTLPQLRDGPTNCFGCGGVQLPPDSPPSGVTIVTNDTSLIVLPPTDCIGENCPPPGSVNDPTRPLNFPRPYGRQAWKQFR